jgi:hypothetical protein
MIHHQNTTATFRASTRNPSCSCKAIVNGGRLGSSSVAEKRPVA